MINMHACMHDKLKGACRGNELRAQKVGEVIISCIHLVNKSGLVLFS